MRISIVMPSLNQAPFLDEALDSVLSQEGAFELELVVMDGGSSDGSLESLERRRDSRLLWTSEPDEGQSDAVNKALARCSGDVIGWLNSDDRYLPGALESVRVALAENEEARWVVGRCRIVDEAGQEIRQAVTRYKNRRLARYSFARLLRENFVSQMGVFWRRDFGAEVGPLDRDLHYTMDYDLWLRMALLAPPLVVDQVLADFRLQPGSKSGAVDREQFDEGHRVARRHGGSDWMSLTIHRLLVERTVLAYRVFALLGW